MEECVQKKLMVELVQGMEIATFLKQQLQEETSTEKTDQMMQRILRSYEIALSVLNSSEIGGAASESPKSVNGNPSSEDVEGARKEKEASSKRRKTTEKWTDFVKVQSESGLEGPNDDGHSWRKYGQKDILGAKYPRSYYRCTYRTTQNCLATKQVQRSDDDHTLFEITYKGSHTCSHCGQIIAPQQSIDQQRNNHLTISVNDYSSPTASIPFSPFSSTLSHFMASPSPLADIFFSPDDEFQFNFLL